MRATNQGRERQELDNPEAEAADPDRDEDSDNDDPYWSQNHFEYLDS